MKTQKFVVVLLCALALLGVADTVTASDAVGPWTKVAGIYSKSNGGNPFVDFESGGMPGCHNDNGGYLGTSSDNSDQAYSALLAALAADREVRVYYNYTGAASGWSMCIIEAVYIR